MPADFHITPTPTIVEETFRSETNKVFIFEGVHIPANLEDYGGPGDIFAFRGIRGLVVERRLFTKTYPTKNSPSKWKEAQVGQRHQKKPSRYLILHLAFPFWPTWYHFGRNCEIANPIIPKDNFDIFFRYRANPQDGWSPSDDEDVEKEQE